MRSYGKVESGFWIDHSVKRWPLDARLVALYLLTSPHANVIGCYHLPMVYAEHEIGLPNARLKEAYAFLTEKGFLAYCHDTEWVWVRKYLRYNGFESGKVAASAVKVANSVPKEAAFYDDFCNQIKDLGRWTWGKDGDFRDRLPVANGLPKPSLPLAKPYPEPNQIQNLYEDRDSGFLESPKNGLVVDSAEALPAPPPEPEPEPPAEIPQAVPVAAPPAGLLDLQEATPEEGAANRKARQLTQLANDAVEVWNTRCGFALGEVQRITDQRKRRLISCLGVLDFSIERWRETCIRIVKSANLRGEKNNTGWKANFDYCIRDDVFTRILEGAYDDAPAKKAPPKRPTV